MVCLGGYWFWFFIRVDVAAEGQSPFRLMRADLFVTTLVLSATFGLIWAWLQTCGQRGLGLRCSWAFTSSRPRRCSAAIPWSKFSHMFFKPAAAFEKRVRKANGTAQNLPTLTRDDPEQQKRHSMELLQNAPMQYGTWHQARSAPPLLRDSPQALLEQIKEPDLCLPSST